MNDFVAIKGRERIVGSLDDMKQQFANPPSEFSPIPFWFWNDELTQEELIRQMRDFHSKEVDGVVIHPRMGLPAEMPYLSEAYMDLVEAAVAEAEALGMKVILYDEGMYPSGSACGLVVRQNADYASRGLEVREYPCEPGVPLRIPVRLLPGEALVSAQAVRKQSTKAFAPDSVVVLERGQDTVEFTPPDAGAWSILLFVDTYTEGTIRGVHPGQDDGETDAPLAADLLNPDAMQAFISLTHEAYYKRLSPYFGTTIIAMFTDEPDLLGRGHREGLKPWTRDFMEEYLRNGGRERDLPALWLDAGEATTRIRDTYEAAVRHRLGRTYYKPLADWCEAHGIGLTGHPAASDDIGLLEHFHIPGQDVVWRYIAPEDDKSLSGVHSTMGKCSSDAARHRGRRRNLNECFGVCGVEGGWSLSAGDMKWYLDWLFVRGVNLISPHAFYYSIRGERRDERPPDVGPNNIWWPEYAQFSRYIKRMSWLMTDSMNGAQVAVLAGAAYLPWTVVKPLYEQQIEFNYLEEELLPSCACKDGTLEIAGYQYRVVVIEDGRRLAESTWAMLEAFVQQGGLVVELTESGWNSVNIGQLRYGRAEDIPDELARAIGRDAVLEPAAATLRLSRITKDGMIFYVIVNEGEDRYDGLLRIGQRGYAELWRPWTGESSAADAVSTEEGQLIALSLARRECLIVAVDPSQLNQEVHDRTELSKQAGTVKAIKDLSAGWHVVEGPWKGKVSPLASWTEWPGMEHYSGTVTYEKRFELGSLVKAERLELDLGEAHEIVRLSVNGREVGVRMWAPYVFEIGDELLQGENVLRVTVANSLANRYDNKSLPSGLIGPIRLIRHDTTID
ncbi:glycosylhydrolase-like jelly roll fold domain-containing protein [Paenibacillus fonticola]|uniref:glycosylhydrolase-like jelly roll fold domain-containing protein n=1 Tax=Paenibacillus fonticola TaxID=379896 RepID=UPI0003724CFF|nr:glycosylhydrolase-like jelly roll fold domain-containing protein [Paenibacillus fonticola]